MIDRPTSSEYAPYYALYVDQVPPGDILELLESELETTLALLASVPAELEGHRYESDKWSVRELVGHLVDVERSAPQASKAAFRVTARWLNHKSRITLGAGGPGSTSLANWGARSSTGTSRDPR